jgi:hypothetical protein
MAQVTAVHASHTLSSTLIPPAHVACDDQWRTQEFCSGEAVQQIQLRTEDRENGDLGTVAP